MKPLTVYDGQTMKRLAYLQNAHSIGYTQNINALWTGEFSMPFSDPKNSYCEPFNFVEMWDSVDSYVGLFRIMPRVEQTLGISASITYTLEHVLGTLLDDVMIGWHEIGNVGVYTLNALAYIIDQQTIPRWEIGGCDYAHQYLYGWQDENLLSALYSVVQPFEEIDYYWSFDTLKLPWKLYLRKASGEAVTDIRYKKNLFGVTKTVDPTNLTTRLYCYGYGDGDNKLTIKDVNDGIPYLESPNVSKYGVITQVWTDARFEIAESLKTTGLAMLKKLEEPITSYELDVGMVANAANLKIGDTVRVVEGLLDDHMIVQKLEKLDVSGAPLSGKILLGKGTTDLSQSMADIAERQRISETYSQGAESIFIDSFYDNADAQNPATITFVVPENAVHVNEIRFSTKLTSFRAYSRATKGGGAGTNTSSEGGGRNVTSASGGGSEETSSSGGGGYSTTNSGGNRSVTSRTNTQVSSSSQDGGGYFESVSIRQVWPSNDGKVHNHGISYGTTLVTDVWMGISTSQTSNGEEFLDDAYVYIDDTVWVPSGDHEHDIRIPGHSHRFTVPSHSHTVDIPSHQHTLNLDSHEHYVDIPSHQHTVVIPSHNHTVTLPNHVHDIEYGIYKGPAATKMDVYLDDILLGSYGTSVKDVNLVEHMQTNANGEIFRGEHSIRIAPNGLTRIEGSYQVRMFTNAKGGGQY